MEKIALVVDDEPANRDFLERLLTQAKFTVYGASSGKSALSQAENIDNLALAMVDMKLPDMNGLELVTSLRRRFPTSRLIIATMYDERSLMEKAFAAGCNVFLVKPHGFMELFQRLNTIQPGPDRLNDLVIDQYGPRPYTAHSRSVT